MANFKASARSVDMLGRQQIAGIPNAINEIFKNAYDAYAKKVRVDYIENDNILFIRDNGYGMTVSDFENKWLMLGTDSKAVASNNYVPKGGTRKVLGEKGIGRLSIATIGQSVLVVTRANREGNISRIVVGFICWPLFEIPGIGIDEIPIPVLELERMPDETIVTGLTKQIFDFYKCLKDSKKYKISTEVDTKIFSALNFKPFSPKRLSYQYVNSSDSLSIDTLNLDDGFSGTHFYITPVEPVLSKLLSNDNLYKSDLGDMQKQLLGFYPSFLNEVKKEMETAFFIYRKNSLFPEDIINSNEFFSINDYAKADHHFEGEFDENGTFHGTISIYGKKTNYEKPWISSYGRTPKCGKFKIRIGFFQGKESESTLNPQEFLYLKSKLDKVGGLYIYKENIRILPYGDNDFDFLKLEKKRTLSAAHYMFSLRRFIGAILLTNEENIYLQEKAGREGFSKNQAYYDFISILQDFFESLLVDFLREKSAKRLSDAYFEAKSELKRLHSIQKAEEEKIKQTQSDFEQQLFKYYSNLKNQKKNNILNRISNEIDFYIFSNGFLEKTEEKIDKLEYLRDSLLFNVRDIESSLYLEKPKVSIGAELFLKYKQYISEYNSYIDNVVHPFRDTYLKKIENELLKIDKHQEQGKKFHDRINHYINEIKAYLDKKASLVKSSIDTIIDKTDNWNNEFSESFDANLQRISSKIQRPIKDPNELSESINEIEDAVATKKMEINRFYEFIVDDLASIESLSPKNTQNYSTKEALIAHGENFLELKKQLDNEYELFQLGTAVSIIQHEFGQTAAAVKHAIETLNAWAAVNDSLKPLYNQLNLSYTHLENYLKLFTPLSRRKKIIKTDVQGKEIFKYINDLFSERCGKDNILITQTKEFEKGIIRIDMAVILPVFINIVDNAMFWIKMNSLKQERKIKFDFTDNKEIIISDNGPGIQELTDEIIFTRGYTTKPGGRGLGLFIAKQILNECGFDIAVCKSQFEKGAGFMIFQKGDVDE